MSTLSANDLPVLTRKRRVSCADPRIVELRSEVEVFDNGDGTWATLCYRTEIRSDGEDVERLVDTRDGLPSRNATIGASDEFLYPERW